jgi:hypothetical protein
MFFMPGYDFPSCGTCRFFKRLRHREVIATDRQLFGGCKKHDAVFDLCPMMSRHPVCANWEWNTDIDTRDENEKEPIESNSYIMGRIFPNLEDGVLYTYLDPYAVMHRPYTLNPEPYAKFSDLPKWDTSIYMETE